MESENAIYLKTTHSEIKHCKFFKITKDKTIMVNCANNKISVCKGITSSPYGIIPCTEKEFEDARSQVLINLNNL